MTHPLPDSMGHTQLRAKCTACGLHFVLFTWEPEKHPIESIYCPECGQHEGRYALWRIDMADPIFQWVPGAADIVDIRV